MQYLDTAKGTYRHIYCRQQFWHWVLAVLLVDNYFFQNFVLHNVGLKMILPCVRDVACLCGLVEDCASVSFKRSEIDLINYLPRKQAFFLDM